MRIFSAWVSWVVSENQRAILILYAPHFLLTWRRPGIKDATSKFAFIHSSSINRWNSSE